jgi:hypothetical protein
MSRSKPPIVALAVIVIAVCVAQVARMTRDGTPFGVAITTVALFAVGVSGGTWVVLILLGRRNRTLLRHVRARQPSNALYPVFLGGSSKMHFGLGLGIGGRNLRFHGQTCSSRDRCE